MGDGSLADKVPQIRGPGFNPEPYQVGEKKSVEFMESHTSQITDLSWEQLMMSCVFSQCVSMSRTWTKQRKRDES